MSTKFSSKNGEFNVEMCRMGVLFVHELKIMNRRSTQLAPMVHEGENIELEEKDE